MESISPDGWAALLGCSRQWRQLVHDNTDTIFLDHTADVAFIAKGVWPRLSLIVLCNQPSDQEVMYSRDLPHSARLAQSFQGSSLSLLAELHMSTETLGGTFLIVAPGCCLNNSSCAATDVAISSARTYLQGPRWQSSRHLSATHVLSAGRKQILACLCSTSFPALGHLNLSGQTLAPVDVALMVMGTWPVLELLDLRRCGLETEASMQLAEGAWPELKVLLLSDNQLDDEAWLHLARGSWRKLHTLWLDGNPLTLSGMYSAANASWCGLRQLRLDTNMVLDPVGILRMVHIMIFREKWCPVLRAFQVPRETCAVPAGLWPHLTRIHVAVHRRHRQMLLIHSSIHFASAAGWLGLECLNGNGPQDLLGVADMLSQAWVLRFHADRLLRYW